MATSTRFAHMVQLVVADHGGEVDGDPADSINWTWGDVDVAAADSGDDTHFVIAAYFGAPVDAVVKGELAKLLLQHAHGGLGDAEGIVYALDPETGEIVARTLHTYAHVATPSEFIDAARATVDEGRQSLVEMLASACIVAVGDEPAAKEAVPPFSLA